MGSCLSKKGAKKKQREHDSAEPIEDCKASLTPAAFSQSVEEEKPVAEDVEAVKEILADTSTVKKPAAEDFEVAEKPPLVDPLKDASATKKKPERSNSLKKKGSFKKEEASDGLARTSSAKEDVDAILIQCGRLSRSSSVKASNDSSNNGGRQYSGSKRQAEDDAEEKTQTRARPSHRRSSSRDLTPRSTSLDGSSKRLTGRRISPSPGRRPEPSPGRRSENSTERSRVRNSASAGVSKRPAKRGSNSGEIGNCSAPKTTSRSRSPAPRIDGGLGLPQSLSRSSSRKAEQSPFRRDPEEPGKNDEESGKIVSSATTTQDENVPGKKERRVALKEINGNSSSIRDQLLSCRGAPTLKKTQQAKSVHDEAVAAISSSHKRNGETEVLEVYADDQTNGAVDVNEVLAQISRSRSARRSRDQFQLENQTLFEASGETELKSFTIPASVSKAHSILEAVADLNSSVNSNSSMKSFVSNVSFEHGKSARFLASYEETEKSEMMRDFHRNVSARNSNADWTEQSQEESAGSNSQTLSRLSAAKAHRYFSSEEDDLTSLETSAKVASKTEEKDDDLKSSSSLRQSSARYFNISPEDVLLNPHLGIKKSEESCSRSNLLPVITLGKKISTITKEQVICKLEGHFRKCRNKIIKITTLTLISKLVHDQLLISKLVPGKNSTSTILLRNDTKSGDHQHQRVTLSPAQILYLLENAEHSEQ